MSVRLKVSLLVVANVQRRMHIADILAGCVLALLAVNPILASCYQAGSQTD
jgi:hypothetical protein